MRIPFAFIRAAAGGGAVPVVYSVSYTFVDTDGGGQRVVVEVDDSTGCTAIKAGGVSFASFATDDSTHVSGVPGAHSAGVVDVVVTNAGGDSTTGTGLIEYWQPGTEASCTLLVEMADYAVSGGVGTWTARVGGDFVNGGTAPTNSSGEPVFSGAGYLFSADNASALLGASGGAIFSVQAPTSEDNPEQSLPYNNKAIWSKQYSGPFELWNATDGVAQWYGFTLFDGSTYPSTRATVASLTTGRHASVATYNASRMRLSVNGSALAGSTQATTGGPLTYGGFPINLGADWTFNTLFSGSIRAFVTFNVEADEALATRCYWWASQRHGTPKPAPDALSLTGWWRASYAGIPWAGRASTGASSGRDLDDAASGIAPSAGTAVNGLTPAHYPSASAQLLSTALSWPSFVGTDFTAFFLVNLATLAADDASPAVPPRICGDNTDSVMLTASTSGVRGFVFDGSAKTTGYMPLSTGAWHIVGFRRAGGNLYVGVDGSWSTGVACGGIAGGGGLIRIGYNGAAHLDGDILEVMVADYDLADKYTDIRDYVNTRYGLSIA
jgi:hypothetical protein